METATPPSSTAEQPGAPGPAPAARPRWSRIALAGGSVGILLVGLVLGFTERDLVAPFVPGGEACRVGSGDDRVRLDTGEAVAASRIVARESRAGASLAAVQRALVASDSTGVSPAEAPAVARALSGRDRAALTCSYDAGADEQSLRLDAAGLTARAAAVRRDLDAVFGRLPKGGFAPGGVQSGHMPGSAHYEGRAVDVFFRPIDDANLQRGWAVAAYLVANAERLDVATVIFDDRIWTTRRSGQGWREYDVDTSGRSAATAAILEHRDHVHVDVYR